MICSVPGIIKKISSDIQSTANELIKLMLKKSIRIINRADNYSYILTNNCIGWTDNAVTNFKLYPKFIKNNKARQKFPAAYAPRERVAYETSLRTIDNQELPYKKFLEYLTAENIQYIVNGNRGGITYHSSVLYTDSWKQLESIGQDILKQINPNIPPTQSIKMSTASLRVKLYTLEEDLEELAEGNPIIFEAYENMVTLINSVQREDVVWIVALIGNLSFTRWENLTPSYRETFIEHLGQTFIDGFNSNELITILLQSDSGELILTSSYLYSLMKMLFIVFGYNGFIPHLVAHPCPGELPEDFTCGTCQPQNYESPCIPSVECTFKIVNQFQDLYPTINELMIGLEIIPPQCGKINCDEITPTYDNLYSIPDYIWKFMEFSYCIYRDTQDLKQVPVSLFNEINNRIRYLNSF